MIPFSYTPQITPDFVIRSLKLKIPYVPQPQLGFSGVTIDSRNIVAGCLFVAIQGETHDGHEFIEKAIQAGARGILCRRGTVIPASKQLAIFPVEDTLSAYRQLAGAWRREFSIPFIVVAGSAGKTTTKELLAAILQGRWPNVLKTKGSQNGFIGIPMTLLELKGDHQAAVIEVGIDDIGTMEEHINLIAPLTSILTAIGPEHLEKLLDLPTVAKEEGIALSLVAKNGGTVVINLDDPWIKPHFNTIRQGRKIPFSLEEQQATLPDMIQGKLSSDKKSISFQGLGIPETLLSLPLLGKHNATNLLGAVTIAASLGFTSDEIQKGLKTFKGAVGRSEICALPGPSQVICDYYNAQPASIRAGIELLNEITQETHSKARWVCLGDMLELGPSEEVLHREIAKQILQSKIENVLLFGPRMAFLFDELKKLNFQGLLEHYLVHAELSESLIRSAKPKDTFLIKGSRGMKMEEIWKVFESYANSHWKNSNEDTDHPTHT